MLLRLVSNFCDYEEQNTSGAELSFSDFIGYLNAQYNADTRPLRDVAGPEEAWLQEDRTTNIEISVLFIFLYRYAVFYGKKALDDSPLATLDEFSFMIVLMTYKQLSKTELINKLIIEKTSGIEVIKRLVKSGMLEEQKNPHDKRSILVALTPKGKRTVTDLLPKMKLVGEAVIGNLSELEVASLSYLLRKLDHFHNENYTQHRETGLEEILEVRSKKIKD